MSVCFIARRENTMYNGQPNVKRAKGKNGGTITRKRRIVIVLITGFKKPSQPVERSLL